MLIVFLMVVYAKCGIIFIEVKVFFFFQSISRDMYQTSLKMDGIKDEDPLKHKINHPFFSKCSYDKNFISEKNLPSEFIIPQK